MQNDALANLPYKSFAGLLEYQTQVRPNKTFFLYPDLTSEPLQYASATFAQVNNAANYLAGKYAKQINLSTNEQKQIVVGLLANNSLDYLLTQYSLVKLGVVVFQLSTRNSKAAMEHLIKSTGVSYLVVGRGQIPIEIDGVKVITLEEVDMNVVNNTTYPFVSSNENSLERVQMIFHSSGSTAFPKPIYYTNRSILNIPVILLDINSNYYTENDTVLTYGAYFHILAFSSIVTCMVSGAVCALPLIKNYPPTPREIVSNVQIEQINKVLTVPILLEQAVNEIESDSSLNFSILSRLAFIAYGGAPLPDNICLKLSQQNVHLVCVYGSTETNISMMKDLNAPLHRWKWMKFGNLRKPFVKITSDEDILIHLPNDPFSQKGIANQVDGSYSTHDVLIEDPPGSGEYRVEGRHDDTLVHSNGEKTNPLPMEQTMCSSPLIKRAHVFGHERLCTGVLIELDQDELKNHFIDEVIDEVWHSIETANETAPTHSRIVRQMVKCIPLNRSLPITHKGNTIRKRIEKEYADVIDGLYKKFLEPTNTNNNNNRSEETENWTEASFRDYVKLLITRINHKTADHVNDTSKSIFDIGFDSLHAVQLRNELNSYFPSIPMNFVYEHSSIDSMVKELITKTDQVDNDPKHYKLTESLIDKYANIMSKDTFVDKANAKKTSDRVFLVTGANGSLGSWIILNLLKDKSVKKIYCLYRGQNKNRIIKEYEQRHQPTDIFYENNSRIVLLNNMQLSGELLGQGTETYNTLCQELTDIVHSAYRMDFNLTVRDFEKDGILGTYNLLKLIRKANGRFHFISSVTSQGSGVLPFVKEEPAIRRAQLAVAQGYGQSKYICEHLCEIAHRLWGTPINVYRVGQMSGDSQHGAWNTTEMISLIICKGGGELGQMPNEGLDIDWIPVDVAASAIVEIGLQKYDENDHVHHIVNPNVTDWSTFLEELHKAGLQFEIVNFDQWMENVLKSNTDLVKLSSFFDTIFTSKTDFLASKYDTTKTKTRAHSMQTCPPFNVNLIRKHLAFWYNIGFLTDGYQEN